VEPVFRLLQSLLKPGHLLAELVFPLDAVFICLGPFVVAVDALLQQFQLLGVAGRAQGFAQRLQSVICPLASSSRQANRTTVSRHSSSGGQTSSTK
jgi:hypothetical protein